MKENLGRLREENETLLSKLQQQEKREEENRKENKTLQEERNHSAKQVCGSFHFFIIYYHLFFIIYRPQIPYIPFDIRLAQISARTNFRPFKFRLPRPKIWYFTPVWPPVICPRFQTDKHFDTKFQNSFPFHFAPSINWLIFASVPQIAECTATVREQENEVKRLTHELSQRGKENEDLKNRVNAQEKRREENKKKVTQLQEDQEGFEHEAKELRGQVWKGDTLSGKT